MAKFNVVARTYRDSRLHMPGEQFVCQDTDEALDKHGLSVALQPADEATKKQVDAAKKRFASKNRKDQPISSNESADLRSQLAQALAAIAALQAQSQSK